MLSLSSSVPNALSKYTVAPVVTRPLTSKEGGHSHKSLRVKSKIAKELEKGRVSASRALIHVPSAEDVYNIYTRQTTTASKSQFRTRPTDQ